VTEVNVVSQDSASLRASEADSADLLAVHESIAGMFATQGNWRRAYEHLLCAYDLARAEPRIPDQFRLEVEQLRRERAQARQESLTDALTATYNRRYLDHRLTGLRTEGRAPAVALVDLDLFKTVNDTFGHRVGDQVLQRVVALLQQSLPPTAFCARYGGEEFVLVLPDTSAGAAIALAERARLRVAQHEWDQLCPGLAVTISIGVALQPETLLDAEDQLLEADSLLYAAKRAGRNLVAYRRYGTVRIVRTVRNATPPTTRCEGTYSSPERG
jgi:two-component system cell cycle response regulator